MMRRLAVACAFPLAAAGAFAAPACTAASGAHTTALVELYTSEGCSSCPPADAWLHDAPGARYRPDQLVALALHVPYWDYIGWTDAFAQPAFAQRQSQLVELNGRRTVYTPHFFVSGVALRDWRGKLDAEIAQVNARPAAARIALAARLAQPGVLAVEVDAAAPATAGSPTLFLAVTEGQLASTVSAGENRGATLRHGHVVRSLVGPLAMPGGRIAARRELKLDAGWQVGELGVAAFVQDGRSVLQAAATAPCRLAP